MRINLNLSRQPFTNHRLFWIAVAAVFFISLWLGLWITAEKTRVSAKASEIEMQIKTQEAGVENLRREEEARRQEEQKVVIAEPDARQLAAARLLIARKAFSWNRSLSEIESYVPRDARITSIKVSEVSSLAGQVFAAIEIKAVGKTHAQMIEMMNNILKSSSSFTIDNSNQEAATDTGEIPFTLNLTYSTSRGGA